MPKPPFHRNSWSGTPGRTRILSRLHSRAAARTTLMSFLATLLSLLADANMVSFLNYSDVASFLGLHRAPLTLPTELNLIFVGFSGDGDAALNVSAATLAPWFQQLRDIVPHTVLPSREGDVAGSADSALQYSTRLRVHRLAPEVTRRMEELISGHLRPEHFGARHAVNAMISEHPPEHLALQMSAHVMSTFLGSLARSLRLPGFSLFVLNPRRPHGTLRIGGTRYGRYGYRGGFSREEVSYLRVSADAALIMQAAVKKHAALSPHSGAPASSGGGKGATKGRGVTAGRGADGADSPSVGSAGTGLDVLAAAWAAGEAAELLSGALRPEDADLGKRGTPEALLARLSAAVFEASHSATAAPVSQPDDRQAAAAKSAGASTVTAEVHTEVHTAGAAARLHRLQLLEVEEALRAGEGSVGCLSDVWLAADEPLGFVDLTAGPFQWGPTGGRGVRTLTTLPDMHTDIETPTVAEEARHNAAASSASGLPDKRELEAERELLRELMLQACARADQIAAGQIRAMTGDDDAASGDVVAAAADAATPTPQVTSVPDSEEQKECDALTARLEAFEQYLVQLRQEAAAAQAAPAVAGAAGRATTRAGRAAAAISNRRGFHAAWHGPADLTAEKAASGAGGSSADGGSSAEIMGWMPGGVGDSHLAPAWLEPRLARLGAAVSLLQAHVLLPPTAATARKHTYAKRVAFHLYVVTAHASYDATGASALALEGFERALLALRLPSQHFTFTTHTLALYEDAGLALAYQTSLRHALLPNMHPSSGAIYSTAVTSLDARELAAALRRAAPTEDGTSASASPSAQTSRVVPIFFFSSDEDVPLFIDKHYLAVAVDDMVLVVQSDHPSVSANTFLCDGEAAVWNLRRPLRAALSATAQLLVGMVPLHMSYNAHSQRSETNFLWSVGSSPLAATSAGLTFGTHLVSLAHRHYVVSGLAAAAAVVDEVRNLLGAIRPSRDAYEVLTQSSSSRHQARQPFAGGSAASGDEEDGGGSAPMLRLQTSFAKLRQLEQRILLHAARRNFDAACSLLLALRTEADRMSVLGAQVARALAPARCAAAGAPAHATSHGHWTARATGVDLWSLVALVLVALTPLCALLWTLWPRLVQLLPVPQRKRPKVNID